MDELDLGQMSEEDSRDYLLQLQAFEHFCTRIGPNPTPNGLFVYYVKHARENPDDVDWIPSRSRNKIYAWAQKYNWEKKYEQRMLRQVERDRQRYEEMRQRGQDNISLLIDDAVLTLHSLLTAGSEKVRLDSAREILDRTGLISHDKLPRKDRDGAAPDTQASLPPVGASADEIQRWLVERQRASKENS